MQVDGCQCNWVNWMEFKESCFLKNKRGALELRTICSYAPINALRRPERGRRAPKRVRKRSEKLRNGSRRRAGGLKSRNADLELKCSGSWAELIFCSNLLPRAFCLFRKPNFYELSNLLSPALFIHPAAYLCSPGELIIFPLHIQVIDDCITI